MTNDNIKIGTQPCRPIDCCDKTGFQLVEIDLPVELKPCPEIGRIETECCGDPYIVCECCECSESCCIVVTQKLKIRIPIKYAVKATAGESCIACEKSGDCCHGDCCHK